jgi:hypothetical protein
MDRRLLLTLIAFAALPAAAHASGGGDEKKKAGGESYLPMDVLLGTTVRPDGRRGVLSVECGLDVPDKALRARAEASIPRLRAAFFQVVQAYAGGLSMGALPDADYIAASLQRRADAVLGRPGARVLLGPIVVN